MVIHVQVLGGGGTQVSDITIDSMWTIYYDHTRLSCTTYNVTT